MTNWKQEQKQLKKEWNEYYAKTVVLKPNHSTDKRDRFFHWFSYRMQAQREAIEQIIVGYMNVLIFTESQTAIQRDEDSVKGLRFQINACKDILAKLAQGKE